MIERLISDEYYTLKDCQNLILGKMQQYFLEIQNLKHLNQLFLIKEMPPINKLFILLQYFCELLQTNILQKDYDQLFQHQVQKFQIIIKNHVRVEHQLRMYTELLEAKLYDYKKKLKQLQMQKIDISKYRSKQYILQKQKDQIKKINQKLSFKMQKLTNPNNDQISQLNEQQILQNFLKTFQTNNSPIQYRFSITDTQPFSFKQKKSLKKFLDIFENENEKPQNLNKKQLKQKNQISYLTKISQQGRRKNKELKRDVQNFSKIIRNKQIKPFLNLTN